MMLFLTPSIIVQEGYIILDNYFKNIILINNVIKLFSSILLMILLSQQLHNRYRHTQIDINIYNFDQHNL